MTREHSGAARYVDLSYYDAIWFMINGIDHFCITFCIFMETKTY